MRIRKAEYIEDYKIKMLFNDDVTKVVDFKNLLSTVRQLVIPLSNLEYFKSFYLDEITICWPNGLDFCPDVLYEIGEEIQEGNNPQIKHKRQNSVKKSQIKYQPTHLRINKLPKQSKS